MRIPFCDLSGQELTEDETSRLILRGPIASMTDRTELHLSKPAAAALARWLGFDVHCPALDELEAPVGTISRPTADSPRGFMAKPERR